MGNVVNIEPYDPNWRNVFRDLGTKLRQAMGDVAIRIDHIGSTSIAGLAAKPIIDIQISVGSFNPMEPYRAPLEGLGFVFRDKNPELTKRYFRECPGERETHIHVRRAGSFSEQFPLLFRDYMRTHPRDAEKYAVLKLRLAEQYRDDRLGYTNAKSDFIWRVIARADQWAQDTGWEPAPSDI
jgi:GrpB-like predicted nucleotidyltransferase (UPF0157 family)